MQGKGVPHLTRSCSHGGTTHLWHFGPPGDSCVVLGYHEQRGLRASCGLTEDELSRDLLALFESASPLHS